MTDLDYRCIYNDSDEDCNKCVKHGYIYRCGSCQDGVDCFGKPIFKKDEGEQE